MTFVTAAVRFVEHAYGLRSDLIVSTEVGAAEAQKIMDIEIHGLRSLPYAELVGYLEPVAHEVQAPSGRISRSRYWLCGMIASGNICGCW